VTVFVNGRYLGGFIFALYLVSMYGAMCLVVVDIYFNKTAILPYLLQQYFFWLFRYSRKMYYQILISFLQYLEL